MKKNHYYQMAMEEEKQRTLNDKRKMDSKNMVKLRRVEAMTNNMMSKEDTLFSVNEARIKGDRYKQIEVEKEKEKKLKELIARTKLRKENETIRVGKQEETTMNYMAKQSNERAQQSAYRNRVD